MQATEIWVRKDDLKSAEVHEVPLRDLSDGEVLMRVDRFGFSSNNITYGVVGEMVGYWKFFPTSDDKMGIIPVWGYAEVEASKVDDIKVGERVFGYFPLGTHLIAKPIKLSPHGFTDGAAHRKDLPMVYNDYRRVSNDEGHDTSLEDRIALLQPVCATSYLIQDFLEDNEFFAAEQVVILSASSKTAIGLAKLLAADRGHGKSIVGLTSPGNAAFVEGLNAYDQVLAYGDMAKLPLKATVYVDMAGNADTRTAIHNHLGENLKYACSVGLTHWDKFASGGELPGPQPVMFFAPSQVEKRMKDWPAGEVGRRIAAAVMMLAKDSESWMATDFREGPDAALALYGEMVAGKVDPARGHMVRI